MQKPFYLIFLLFVLFGCSKKEDLVVEPQWKILNTPSTNNLTDISFLNDDFGVVCGAFGTVLKTDDSGNSWQSLNVGVGYSFSSVFVLNDNEFFTSRLGLYKTNNSGDSFEEIGDISGLGSSITDIHFFSSQNGIICKGGVILRTVDSGNNWATAYDFEGYASKLAVTTNSTIYLAGGRTYDSLSEGEMHKSVDNGITWEVLTLPDEIANSEITAIHFLNNLNGYISTIEGEIFNTLNGGENWTMKAELNIGTIFDLTFFNDYNGYLVSNNKVYKTRDGGVNWFVDYQTESTNYLTNIISSPNGKLFVSGQNGLILKKE